MPKLFKNMLMFTVGLAIVTLAVEFFRKGEINIESPQYFALAIFLLGTIGGWIYTWTYEKDDWGDGLDFRI